MSLTPASGAKSSLMSKRSMLSRLGRLPEMSSSSDLQSPLTYASGARKIKSTNYGWVRTNSGEVVRITL